MISSLKSAGGSCGAYIGAARERQAAPGAASDQANIAGRALRTSSAGLQQFRQYEPCMQRASWSFNRPGRLQPTGLRRVRPRWRQLPLGLVGMADTAEIAGKAAGIAVIGTDRTSRWPGQWDDGCYMRSAVPRNHLQPDELVRCHHNIDYEAELAMNSRITETSEQIDRETSRLICDAVGDRLQQSLRPEGSALPTYLEHLMDELRKQEASSRQMPPN
jgi:hypothetical protein